MKRLNLVEKLLPSVHIAEHDDRRILKVFGSDLCSILLEILGLSETPIQILYLLLKINVRAIRRFGHQNTCLPALDAAMQQTNTSDVSSQMGADS